MNPIDYWYQKYLKEKLTWKDIKTILQIVTKTDWYDFEISGKLWSQEFYEEVLKRFNEAKGK